MDILHTVVFVHVAAAVGLFISLSIEWLILRGLGRATSYEQAREWMHVWPLLGRIGAPSVLTALASGVYLARSLGTWQVSWVAIALPAIVAMAHPWRHDGTLAQTDGCGAGRARRRAARCRQAATAPSWLAGRVIAHPHGASRRAAVRDGREAECRPRGDGRHRRCWTGVGSRSPRAVRCVANDSRSASGVAVGEQTAPVRGGDGLAYGSRAHRGKQTGEHGLRFPRADPESARHI